MTIPPAACPYCNGSGIVEDHDGDRPCAGCTGWPSPPMTAHTTELREELLLTITAGIIAHPRSQQEHAGPSEIGTPCPRKLAHKLAGTLPANDDISWRPTVGTAVHTWLAETFSSCLLPDGTPRHLVEQRVMCGVVDGRELWGTCDLYDRATATVVDWKIPGPTSLRKAKGHGPSPTYQAQAHLYGQGFVNAGHQVTRVAIAWLPAAGELDDAVIWSEPFNPQVAADALDRATRIARGIALLGAATVIDSQQRVDDYCHRCQFLVRGTTDPTTGCPGVDNLNYRGARVVEVKDASALLAPN